MDTKALIEPWIQVFFSTFFVCWAIFLFLLAESNRRKPTYRKQESPLEAQSFSTLIRLCFQEYRPFFSLRLYQNLGTPLVFMTWIGLSLLPWGLIPFFIQRGLPVLSVLFYWLLTFFAQTLNECFLCSFLQLELKKFVSYKTAFFGFTTGVVLFIAWLSVLLFCHEKTTYDFASIGFLKGPVPLWKNFIPLSFLFMAFVCKEMSWMSVHKEIEEFFPLSEVPVKDRFFFRAQKMVNTLDALFLCWCLGFLLASNIPQLASNAVLAFIQLFVEILCCAAIFFYLGSWIVSKLILLRSDQYVLLLKNIVFPVSVVGLLLLGGIK